MEKAKRNRDILTIDDVELEIRVPLIMRRKRKELEQKIAINKLMMNAELAHAVAVWPQRLALPEGAAV